ncbi:DUF2304 family protein [Candidatus Falkowbacteria bacterium]|nr:DUF2304 family protein [Candidatus Falkowbacteria bacterium]
MFQQIIALIIILAILARIAILKKKKKIGASEFIFWSFFWILAAVFISAIKWIDQLVARLGFSGTGIEVLLYLAIVVLFYLNFRLRLKLEKMDKDITKLVRFISIKEEDRKSNSSK